jgi:hypothetical protein
MGQGEAFFFQRCAGGDFAARDCLGQRSGDAFRTGWAGFRSGGQGGKIKWHRRWRSMSKGVLTQCLSMPRAAPTGRGFCTLGLSVYEAMGKGAKGEAA